MSEKDYEVYGVRITAAAGYARWFTSSADEADRHLDAALRFTLSWSANLGFGEFTFIQNVGTGELRIDNECLSKEFIKEVLCKMVDNARLIDESQPEEDTGVEGLHEPEPQA